MAPAPGAVMATIGPVEGLAEATASMVKVLSGAISDRSRRRETLVVAGGAFALIAGLGLMNAPAEPKRN